MYYEPMLLAHLEKKAQAPVSEIVGNVVKLVRAT